MSDIIKVNYDGNRQTVSARKLWEFLEKPWGEFLKWFNQYKDYGFIENIDYKVFECLSDNPQGGRPSTNFEITIDMAKELAMLQKTEKGKQARQYFIELEKKWNSPELIMARALKMADNKILSLESVIIEKESKIKELIPAAEFGNTVGNCQDAILIRDFAKLLANDGITIGQDGLFDWLHIKNYIYKDKFKYKNPWRPYQQFVNQGLFRVKETPISTTNHGDKINITIKITGKGQKYFYEKLKEAVS